MDFDVRPGPDHLGPDRWSYLDPIEKPDDALPLGTAGLKSAVQTVQPTATSERSSNPLRPSRFADMIGQEEAKAMLQRELNYSQRRNVPLDHILLVGPSGTGKTTFAHVIANELGTRVFQVEAPISHDTLVELAETMEYRDILFIDEIHQQAILERRGKSSATQPEVLFGVMEDRTLTTAHGVVPFPHITVMGATTDEGMLPDPFINRFPVRPEIERYTVEDMRRIVLANAEVYELGVESKAATILAKATRGIPREANNLVKNAVKVTDFRVTPELALEVLKGRGLTQDGLTRDMQRMLTFLLTRAKHVRGDGEVKYSASVSTIATAIGKSRDQKAIALRVEPYLIEQGYVQVGHGGRSLTPAGVARATALLED